MLPGRLAAFSSEVFTAGFDPASLNVQQQLDMAIIEVGCMIVKPEKNVLDGSTTEGQILNKAWNSVLVAPDGPRWNCWGVEAGDSRRLWGFFEFESIEHHAEFAKT